MSDEDRIASILGEWQERRDRGEAIDPEAVIAEHPDLADRLRAKFEALAALDATRAGESRSTSPTRLRELPLDRYADFRPAGEGGMGIVYWAIDTDLNREVAFKVIRPGVQEADATTPAAPVDLSAPAKDTPASQAFETLKQRFLQEAWVTGGLSHPGIVPVYELGETPEGVPYYTMRFVKGERTLADAIEEMRDKDIEERLKLLEPFLKICDTLSYAHAKGVIHRDLKPDNIALGEFGEVVVIDWGLAKIKDRPDVAHERWQDRIQEYREAKDLRTVASAMGTPGYMAPEAAKGQTDRMGARCDVYSLGAILFQILTGRLPFDFETFGELIHKLLREDPPTAIDVADGVPEALSALSARCLERDPEARPHGADEIATAIRDWQAQSAADREVEGLVRDARTALRTALTLTGSARLRQVDSAAATCAAILERRPDHADARALRREIEDLRRLGVREKERQARRRVLLRGGIALLVVATIASLVVARLLEDRRQEAEAARVREAQERARADHEAYEARRLAVAETKARGEAQVSLARAYAYVGLAELEAGRSRSAQVAACRSLATARTARGHAVLRDAHLGMAPAARVIGQNPEVTTLLATPDGRWLWGVSRFAARVWDLETGRSAPRFSKMPWEPIYGNLVRGTALSRDGTRLYVAYDESRVEVWDPWTEERIRALRTEKPLGSLVPSPDGSRLYAVAPDVGFVVVDGTTGETVGALESPRPAGAKPFRGLSISDDGLRLFTTEVDEEFMGVLCVWSAETRELEACVAEHIGPITALRPTPDGVSLYTAGVDGTVRLWRASAPDEHPSLRELDGPIEALALSADGTRLAVAALQERVFRILDAATGDDVRTIEGHGHVCADLAFTVDGRRLAAASSEEGLRIFDVETGRCLAAAAGHPEPIGALAIDRRAGRLYTGSEDGSIRTWDGETRLCLGVDRAHEKEVTALHVLAADGRLASGDAGGTIRVREAASDAKALVLTGHTARVSWLTADREGGVLWSASVSDRSVRVWDLETGQEILLVPGLPLSRPTPEGRVVVGTEVGAALWDLDAGEALTAIPFEDLERVVDWGVVDADGDRFFVPYAGGVIRVLDFDAGQETEPIPGPGSDVRALHLAADGRVILAGDLAGEVRTLNVESHSLRGRGRATTTKGDAVVRFVEAPDAGIVFSVTAGGVVRGWDVGTGRPVITFEEAFAREPEVLVRPDAGVLHLGMGDWVLEMDLVHLPVRTWPAVVDHRPSADGARLHLLVHDPRPGVSASFQIRGTRGGASKAGFPVTYEVSDRDPNARPAFAVSPDEWELYLVGQTPLGEKHRGGPEWWIRVWDVEAREEVEAIPLAGDSSFDPPVRTMVVSPDGERLFVALDDAVDRYGPQIEVLDLTARRGLALFAGLPPLGVSPDGGRLYFTDATDGSIRAWAVERRELEDWRLRPMGWVTHLCLAADGRHLHALSHVREGTTSRGAIEVWDVRTGVRVLLLEDADAEPHPTRGGIAVSADGMRLFSTAFAPLSGGSRRDAVPLVRIWDLETQTVLASVEGLGPLTASADGRTLCATNGQGRPWLYDLDWSLSSPEARLLDAEERTGLVMEGLRFRSRGAADLLWLVDDAFPRRRPQAPWSR